MVNYKLASEDEKYDHSFGSRINLPPHGQKPQNKNPPHNEIIILHFILLLLFIKCELQKKILHICLYCLFIYMYIVIA